MIIAKLLVDIVAMKCAYLLAIWHDTTDSWFLANEVMESGNEF